MHLPGRKKAKNRAGRTNERTRWVRRAIIHWDQLIRIRRWSRASSMNPSLVEHAWTALSIDLLSPSLSLSLQRIPSIIDVQISFIFSFTNQMTMIIKRIFSLCSSSLNSSRFDCDYWLYMLSSRIDKRWASSSRIFPATRINQISRDIRHHSSRCFAHISSGTLLDEDEYLRTELFVRHDQATKGTERERPSSYRTTKLMEGHVAVCDMD